MPHRRHIRRALPAVLAAGALLLAGCGGEPEVNQPPAATAPSPTPTTPAPSPTPTTAEPTTEPPEPALPKLGQKQTTDLGTATVYSVKFPVQASGTAARIRDKGMQFAVADIKVCSNGEVDEDGYAFDAGNFQLVDDQARAYEFWNVQVSARSPNLVDSVSALDTPRKGSCKRGWLTFQLPPKTKVASVDYSTSGGTPLTWQVKE